MGALCIVGEGSWSDVACDQTAEDPEKLHFPSCPALCPWWHKFFLRHSENIVSLTPLLVVSKDILVFLFQGEHLEYHTFAPRELPGSSHPRRLFASLCPCKEKKKAYSQCKNKKKTGLETTPSLNQIFLPSSKTV